MPRTKKANQTIDNTEIQPLQEDVQANDQPTDTIDQPKPDRQSQLATILIGLLIIASGLLLYNYVQTTNTPETKTTADQTQSTVTPTPSPSPKASITPTPTNNQTPAGQSNYTVQSGDSLWTIAEKVYGNGFDWGKIDQANHLEHNAVGQPVLEAGQLLTIPGSAANTSQPSNQVATNDHSGIANRQLAQTPVTAIQTYTVQHGDTLWSIAQAVYGKGEDWTRIYHDPRNNLGPRADGTPLIHAGNVLVIPQT